jgi:hypothetical protein|tara:strand:- start:190 stop:555 length:366 start_codon:yes stop_codon:yes gene_type:complete
MNKLPNIEYNGWTNYETWRLNLEYFNGSAFIYRQDVKQWLKECEDYDNKQTLSNGVYDYLQNLLAKCLRQSLNTYVDDNCKNDFLKGLLRSFVSDVNYHEIAKHILEEILEELELDYELAV